MKTKIREADLNSSNFMYCRYSGLFTLTFPCKLAPGFPTIAFIDTLRLRPDQPARFCWSLNTRSAGHRKTPRLLPKYGTSGVRARAAEFVFPGVNSQSIRLFTQFQSTVVSAAG